ncbi:Nramp family divalent metal transporter [candidate division KSB1 bacterium]|nr:Nramp family divalent metal transporter [candidate division KSB1 bacterium]
MSPENTKSIQETPPIPTSFWGYIKSFGPGLVVVLTWLGAGDLVNSAAAGSNYGYALMWGLAISLLFRFFIVNVIARYHLCNQHGETVMAAFKRIHPIVPILLGIAVFAFGHIYSSYMIKGIGEATHHLLYGFGSSYIWSLFWVALITFLVFAGKFDRVQRVFYLTLGLLTLSLLGIAIYSGPNVFGIVKGTFLFEIPRDQGSFSALLIVVSLIGAVAGSVANLLYPYFIQQKGWIGPRYRKVQRYDLFFGIIIIIVLDLAVWVVGAEELHTRGLTISTIEDLANLLKLTLGRFGGIIFYVGVLAALFNALSGAAMGYSYLLCDIIHKIKTDEKLPIAKDKVGKMLNYKLMVLWCLLSPLIWLLPGMPDFITMTVLGNAASVILFPVISLALWYITANTSYIGTQYKNKWWENILIAILVIVGIVMSYFSVVQIASKVAELL